MASSNRNLGLPITTELEHTLREIIKLDDQRRIFDYVCPSCWGPVRNRQLGALECRDGRKLVYGYCSDCWYKVTDSLPMPDGLRDRVPIIEYTYDQHRPCQVRGCDSQYSQAHHIIPREISREWREKYPTVDLCIACHERWHDLTGLGL